MKKNILIKPALATLLAIFSSTAAMGQTEQTDWMQEIKSRITINGYAQAGYAYSDQNRAEQKYHSVLSSAAVSALPKHTCFMLTDDGYVVKSECYKHEVEPEPESEEQDG